MGRGLALAVLAAVILAAQPRWARYLYREGHVALGVHAGVSWLVAAALAAVAAAQPRTVPAALAPALAVAALAGAPNWPGAAWPTSHCAQAPPR